MRIGWIQALEFRNYRTLSWTPAPALNLLSGANAQGKTNLLEALAFLATGRSFRTRHLADLPRWGAGTAAVTGELRRGEGATVVRRVLTRREDGGWQGSGAGCPWARAVAFGWQDLEILTGGPAVRRAFLDGVAARLAPAHRAALQRYRAVLTRRNRLLQQPLPERVLAARLAPWDEQLAAVGLEVLERRRRAAAALQTEVGRIYPALVGEAAKVELRYRSSAGEVTEPAAYLAALEAARPLERRLGQTAVGPHRDDLAIEIEGVDARRYGSRGRQRLLALALRLAEVLPVAEAAGSAPVLLLDDPLSELDGRAREHVLRELQAAEQVFVTSPEPVHVPGAACWTVRGGALSAA